ncbi:MAG: hypothetical protein ACOY94_03765 [Bacillota bacterium]
MKARLILWLIQALGSRRGQGFVVALVLLLLAPLFIVSHVVPITIPLVSEEQIQQYKAVAQGLPPGVEVDWRQMVAVDAVQYRQDFSQVDLTRITQTGAAFTFCETQTNVQMHPITFEAQAVGDTYNYTFGLDGPGEVSWSVTEEQGAASVDLTNGAGQPVSGGPLDPGYYTLWIEATQAPALIHVDLYTVSEVQVCHGKPVDQVMAEMGFSEDEKQLAHVFMNTLSDMA